MNSITTTFVRHAESENNASTANLIGGQSLSVPLTEKGQAQARVLGAYFKKNGIVFNAAYSSTALRTQQTAELCFKAMECDLLPLLDSRLLEQSGGGWEGQSRDIYRREDVRAALDTDNWNYVPGDDQPGESQQMVASRMIDWVKETVAEYSQKEEDQHIIIFTHGLAIKFLLATVLDLERATAYREDVNPIANTSITQLCFLNGQIQFPLMKRNNVEHLMFNEDD